MTLTAIFITVIVVAIAIFDVYIIAKEGKYESISAYIIRGSKKYPLITLIAGMFLGHLYFSMDTFDHMPKEQLIIKCKEVLK